MKRRLIAVAITLGLVSTVATTTVKALGFDTVYDSTYKCVTQLKELGNKYHITPRHFNNGSKMEDNKLKDVVASVDEIQPIIYKLREYQHQFPNEYWKARNTFSEIGDGYQQPIYEWIVDIAIRLQKEVMNVNNLSKDKLADFITRAEYEVESANKLNKGVDPAYRGAYKAALNDVLNKLNTLKPSQEVKPAVGKQYLSDGKLTQLLADKFGKGEWNDNEELAQFRNMFHALINGTVDEERIMKDIVSPSDQRRSLENIKDPMNIHKVWKEKASGKWKCLLLGSMISKFDMNYTEDAQVMADHMKHYYEGNETDSFESSIHSGKNGHIEYKVVRHGDKMTVYVMSLGFGYPRGYNPDLGYTE